MTEKMLVILLSLRPSNVKFADMNEQSESIKNNNSLNLSSKLVVTWENVIGNVRQLKLFSVWLIENLRPK